MSLNLCSEHGWAVLDWRLVTGSVPPGFPPYTTKPAYYVHRHHYEGAVRAYFEDWSEAYWEAQTLNGCEGPSSRQEPSEGLDHPQAIESDERRPESRTEAFKAMIERVKGVPRGA